MPDLSTLNNFDWIVLGVMVWSIVWAAWHGFAHELFSLIGLVVAFAAAAFMGYWLDGPLADMLPDSGTARIVSRAIVFLGVVIIINILAKASAAALRAVLSRPIDHSLGMLFGFIRAAMLLVLPFTLVYTNIDSKHYPDWLTKARSYRYMEGGAKIIEPWLPEKPKKDKKEEKSEPETDSTGNFPSNNLWNAAKELLAS